MVEINSTAMELSIEGKQVHTSATEFSKGVTGKYYRRTTVSKTQTLWQALWCAAFHRKYMFSRLVPADTDTGYRELILCSRCDKDVVERLKNIYPQEEKSK